MLKRDPDKLVAKAEAKREQALRLISQRRAMVIADLTTKRFNLTGGAFSSEVSKYAQELFYLDQAYDSISRRGAELADGSDLPSVK